MKISIFAGKKRPLARGFIFLALKLHGGLLLKSFRLDESLSSNLLKTDFPLKLTIHKCQRKQQCYT